MRSGSVSRFDEGEGDSILIAPLVECPAAELGPAVYEQLLGFATSLGCHESAYIAEIQD